MGVDGRIKPRKGKSLRSAVEVQAAFERFFPTMRFTRCSDVARDLDELRAFAKSRLPFWAKVVFVGPTTPHYYQGDLKGEGWSMLVEFDDSGSVPAAFLSFYGEFGPALSALDELVSVLPWRLKVY